MSEASRIQKVAFLGGHIPRQCGIATFTADLRNAVAGAYPESECQVVAMTDRRNDYSYPPVVRYEVHQEDRLSYRQAADFLNLLDVEVLSLQHEFGIYGGRSGVFLLDLLQRVEMPVVATMHTVLSDPTDDQRYVMDEMRGMCDRFVVMADHGRDLLHKVYDVPRHRIDVIPHGVIDVPFLDPEFNKEHFGVMGRRVMLTFGLLSPGKGIEDAIRSLPAIVAEHPEVVYIIAGVTHPHLLESEGEAYREMLQSQVDALGMTDHVKFENRFLDMAELTSLIEASDIYVTPYLNEAQITSGTLAYAFGAGKAIVSTPYWHADELLADGRGLLVPFSKPSAIADAVNRYLGDPCLMTEVRTKAYELGREMTWPNTGRKYMASFDRALARRFRRATVERGDMEELPQQNFRHLVKLTSGPGVYQHAVHNVPNYGEGYCVDDNARAYLLTVTAAGLDAHGLNQPAFAGMAGRYLAFLRDSVDPETGAIRNFMSRDQQWLERAGSDDSHGRLLWAIGAGVGYSRDNGHRAICAGMMQQALPKMALMTSPRAWAFTLLGIEMYLLSCPGDRLAIAMRERLVDYLMDLYRTHASVGWRWFESVVAYDNARLSQALIECGASMGSDEVRNAGLDSLRWLADVQTAEGGWFSPVGCHGFWQRGGRRARFDQQPIEACAMVSACLDAARVTGDREWSDQARVCFDWFTGYNDLGVGLYDPVGGGCCDGLMADRVNRNQGAESTLSFHLALVDMELARQARNKKETVCMV